jgi:acyl carrier protein
MSIDLQNVLERIRPVLAQIADDGSASAIPIDFDTNVVTDLGLTSLKVVDLTLSLEDALGLGEYPIQEWIDEERAKEERGFTVRSIVEKCANLIAHS